MKESVNDDPKAVDTGRTRQRHPKLDNLVDIVNYGRENLLHNRGADKACVLLLAVQSQDHLVFMTEEILSQRITCDHIPPRFTSSPYYQVHLSNIDFVVA